MYSLVVALFITPTLYEKTTQSGHRHIDKIESMTENCWAKEKQQVQEIP